MIRKAFIATTISTVCLATAIRAEFVHPGCLSTQADLDRMAAKVAAGEQPWKGSWDKLVANTDRWRNHKPEAIEEVKAGGGGRDTFMRLARDVHRAYQLALRYHGDGSTWAADKAVEIFNAWAETNKTWKGDTNASLRRGIYGYQFACAAELLRDYGGWKKSDFSNFQEYMVEQFYGGNAYFLYRKHGTVGDHYWSNWTQSNVASMLAIGVLCDRQDIFDEGLSYFKGLKEPQNGPGTENIERSILFRHPNGLGQWQESGRDQGHTLMGPQLTGTVCEIAWNQGIDLYGYKDNLFLAAVEYISKYNMGEEVPWVTYVYIYGHPGKEKYWVQGNISSHGRGQNRPGWDLVYNHYVNRLGMAVPWTAKYAKKTRPEGGGFNYGGSSGGFDGLGFTTLTHSRDPIEKGAVPGSLIPFIEGRKITLSWAGSAYAESYNVKRATTAGGPYETLAIVAADRLHYADMGLTPGQTYYYVVSANNPNGETADSPETAATADHRLQGKIIGTEGSYNDSGAGRQTVFDNALFNYFDGPEGESWAGLDLGPDVRAVITAVKYCPRTGLASRMVGGRFQGSNRPDFKSGVEDLFTISEEPPEGVLTHQPISNTRAFRYVRYIGPSDGSGNVAEVQFLGETSGSVEPLPASRNVQAKPAGASQIDLTWNEVPGADRYYVKRATTREGPFIIVANMSDTCYRDSDLNENTMYFYLVSAINPAGESPQARGAIAITFKQLTGTPIGSNGSWNNNPDTTKEAALDGRFNTYYDAKDSSKDWVGIDFGSDTAQGIAALGYAPRPGMAKRMVGGTFQGSNSARGPFTDLFKVTTKPSEGVLTTQKIDTRAGFRYVRYIGPDGASCNVAEIEFYGMGDGSDSAAAGMSQN